MLVRALGGNAPDGSFNLPENVHVTRREIGALVLVANGLDNEDAAKKLGVSANTFRNHVYNVMQKLGANNRAHGIVLAIQNDIIGVVEKRTLDRTALDRYRFCMSCGRCYAEKELVEVEGETITVNHVRMTLPPRDMCPYEGCDGEIQLSVHWEDVREDHPEYPEIPERGVRYEFDLDQWLRDMRYVID